MAQGLKLIAGTEIQVEYEPRQVLLTTNCESYGIIASLMTQARTRAAKGSYSKQETASLRVYASPGIDELF